MMHDAAKTAARTTQNDPAKPASPVKPSTSSALPFPDSFASAAPAPQPAGGGAPPAARKN
jgi:hypothetical protein